MKSDNLATMDSELIADQLMKLFKFLLEHPGSTKKAACTELNINYRAALRWIKQGMLHEYLSSIHDVRSDLSQIIALNELPSIVEFQARVARGEVPASGANPTAAANFVLEIAKLGAHREVGNFRLSQINVFVPEMPEPGTPAIDAPGKLLKD